MDFLHFIFCDAWHFIGMFLIMLLAVEFIKEVFDFFVELVHGKPVVQNINIPKDSNVSFASKKNDPQKDNSQKMAKDIKGSIKIDGAKVSVK